MSLEEGVAVLSPTARPWTAAYWARGTHRPLGRNDHGTFVRPDDGSNMDTAGRTAVPRTSSGPSAPTSTLSRVSRSNDGYLNLYVDNFNPNRPSTSSWLATTTGSTPDRDGWRQPRISELQRNKTYYVVTSACVRLALLRPRQRFFRNVRVAPRCRRPAAANPAAGTR